MFSFRVHVFLLSVNFAIAIKLYIPKTIFKLKIRIGYLFGHVEDCNYVTYRFMQNAIVRLGVVRKWYVQLFMFYLYLRCSSQAAAGRGMGRVSPPHAPDKKHFRFMRNAILRLRVVRKWYV